jgi:hypothetical protein
VTAIVPTVVPELLRKLILEAAAENVAAVDKVPLPETVQPDIVTVTTLLLL